MILKIVVLKVFFETFLLRFFLKLQNLICANLSQDFHPPRGFVQTIAVTKEDVMTLQSWRKSPPIAASYPGVTASMVVWLFYCFIASISYQRACGQRC